MSKNVDVIILRNSLNYLNAISAMLPNNLGVLKASYKLKLKYLTMKCPTHDSNIRQMIGFNRATSCSRCLIDYDDGPSTFRIERSKKLKRKFYQKLIRKHKLKGKKLTPYQEKILRRILKIYYHKLVTCCQFCKKKTGGKILKKLLSIHQRTPEIISPKLLQVKKSKKSKKKDKYCGLNASVIQNLNLSKKINTCKKFDVDDDVIILDDLNHRPIIEEEKPIPIHTKKEKKKTKEQIRVEKIQSLKAEQRKNNKKKVKLENLRNLLKEKKKESPASKLAQFMQGLPV